MSKLHRLDDSTRTHLRGIEEKLLFLSEAVKATHTEGSDGLAGILGDIAWDLNQLHGKDEEPAPEAQ